MAIASARPGSGQPMMEMNTTPLIDVMLVLLIMFIMTIPMATNSIDMSLPSPSGGPTKEINPVTNRISVTRDGAIQWNGQGISQSQLAAQLSASLKLPIEPELQFRPDADASYDISARVMRTIKASGATKFGYVDNERYAEFGKPVR